MPAPTPREIHALGQPHYLRSALIPVAINNMKPIMLCLLMVASIDTTIFAGDRIVQPLSGPGWRLLHDKEANWKNDELFLPGTELTKIPNNAPTGGWEKLNDQSGMAVSVPGTVEQFLGNGEIVKDDFFENNKKPNQDLTGVSWWWRKVLVPESATGRRVLLKFEGVRERAEVYVNGKLVGYDIVGSSPFEVDVTDQVKSGKPCQLAVRVTNPGGTFSWGDIDQQPWGKYKLPLSRNFSGITAPVKLVVCSPVSIEDLYVQNTPAMRDVNLEVTLRNQTNAATRRNVLVTITDNRPAGKELFREEIKDADIPVGESKQTIKVSAPNAKLWDIEHPNLYTMTVALKEGSMVSDSDVRTFGFRWFGPEGFGKDALLRLNGKKIVLRSAISWGYWPVSGIVPSPEQAERQIRVAKQFGLNMLSFHRCMGQSWVLDKADEMGLLYYAEPGGYTSGGKDPFTQAICLEKFKRMAKLFRSHPSMAIYNMINEQWSVYGADKDPTLWAKHKSDMKAVHEVDPSRIIGYTSSTTTGDGVPAKMKLHMRPFDMQHYELGWADAHESIGPVVWQERGYRDPTNFLVRARHKTEIAIRGEEGAISSPPRVGLIKAEIDTAPHKGWDGITYLKWYDDFATFLDRKGLKPYFPTVDSLSTSMGKIALEQQGRFMQNFRISNDNDIYMINGWEAQIVDDHSGVVDCYRNPKADPEIMAQYNQPLYVAIMSRNLVVKSGEDATVDFFIVNEKDIKGAHTLRVCVKDSAGNETFKKDLPVQITGGDVYGQLLTEAVKLPFTGIPGMSRIEATLLGLDKKGVANGHCEILAVDWKSQKLTGAGARYEYDGAVGKFLNEQKGVDVPSFDDIQGKLDWLVVARPPQAQADLIPSTAFLTKDGQPGINVSFLIDNKPVGQRVEKDLRLDVPVGASADSSVPPMKPFLITWDGTLIPPTTGNYIFTARGTQPKDLQVTLNGKSVFGKVGWWVKGEITGSVELEAGKPVTIFAESRSQGDGSGKFELCWSVPGRGGVEPQKLLDRVSKDGTTLIIADYAEGWMPIIAQATGTKYNGKLALSGDGWMTGQYFVRDHPLFKELPVNCGLDWPYEKVVQAGRSRYFMKMEGEEFVAGGYHTFRPRGFGTAVGVIPFGKGKIIVSSLDIVSNLASKDGPADVARKLLVNYIEYAGCHPGATAGKQN